MLFRGLIQRRSIENHTHRTLPLRFNSDSISINKIGRSYRKNALHIFFASHNFYSFSHISGNARLANIPNSE